MMSLLAFANLHAIDIGIVVAICAWIFSMVFPLREFILVYFQATGAIFTGGAGAVLIGGLYWKRGTAIGAWASMIVGTTLAVAGVLLINLIWPNTVPALQTSFPEIGWIAVAGEVLAQWGADGLPCFAFSRCVLRAIFPALSRPETGHRPALSTRKVSGESTRGGRSYRAANNWLEGIAAGRGVYQR